MNLIKRLRLPTPKKYKRWGKIMKNISYSLGIGLAGAIAFSLPTLLVTIVGVVIFTTSSISTFCYAQIEKEDNPDKVKAS